MSATHLLRPGALRYTRCGRRVPAERLVEAKPSCELCRLVSEGRNGPPRVLHVQAPNRPEGFGLCGREAPPHRFGAREASTCKGCLKALVARPVAPCDRSHLVGVGGKTACGLWSEGRRMVTEKPECFRCQGRCRVGQGRMQSQR